MAIKFLSFLGTGTYIPCHYTLNGMKSAKTEYIQTALLDLLAQDGHKMDEVFIFLTEGAKKKHWDAEINLKAQLEDLAAAQGFKISTPTIKVADDMETIWETFGAINETIQEGDEIVFDITHSFRYQPMLALLSLHFLRVTKDVKVSGIYYGAYVPNSGQEDFPVINLSAFAELQDWITNVYAFTQTGRADALTAWIAEKETSIRRTERKTTIDIKNIQNLSKSWQQLTDAMQTNRGPKIQASAAQALQSIEEIKTHEIRPAFQPLNALFSKVQDSIETIASEDEIKSGLAAIEWCMKHGLTQQAYTMITELTFTAICLKNNADPIKDRRSYSLLLKSAVKVWEKGKENEVDTMDNSEQIKELLQFPALLRAYHLFSDYRNDINHAGWRVDSLKPSVLKDTIENNFPEYKQSLLAYWKS